MTDRGLQVLQEISRSVSANGYAPTVRELCQAVGLSSTSTVQAHLHNLQKEGLVETVPGKLRTLRITLLGQSALRRSELAA